ncbi:putative histone deacetylase [Leptomonas pyrrhocoris]|uniref:histone deacetylase n=1 Tax=Leptomonas pyrrhocoris TaxID=157538 RepID=A0A0M9FRM8_LEPPY|nr:putative histone deacetylase [Leptomonas pyrrhocoris]XP_015653100.1 putative histone deacetylase [Leptomonas pyrrhocoris]KPA74660.1 putative histone deacetylase [Leptomonas pyrrhocoris]KPA74661.1 putative histone deacetylase [Leptomonas pyrrhocoris]|eukprot:XP_015653099.1 putative histone deacetylase [Leptomonas pyrrhocoris]
MPPSRFSRPKLSGTVTVRRFQQPQLETVVKISKGELSEGLEAIASRVGLGSSSSTDEHTIDLCLVDEQELALMGKLVDKGVYYLSGGVLLPTHESVAVCHSASNIGGSGASSGRVLAPDCAVLWAFDPRMLLHRPLNNRSPETPYRLQCAVKALQQCERANDILPAELLGPLSLNMDGSMQRDLQPDPAKVSSKNRARWIPARCARADEVYSFHAPESYRDFIERGVALTSLKSDVYCNEETSSVAARLSVGAVVDASVKVLQGVGCLRRDSTVSHTDVPLFAYCLVRPPGHHCTSSQPSGFCLLNNVAVAAAQLRQQRSVTSTSGMPRIAILDLDVHFGEGSASFVEGIGDPQTLLYLSLHRYDKQKFYPFDQRGDSAYVGRVNNSESPPKGCICNVAVHTNANNPTLCEHVISDHLMNGVLEEIFLPRLEAFQPDVVLVSLGFDAAYGDPLGKMAVENGFASVIARLKHWCIEEGRIVGLVVVLEGGYNPTSVAQGAVTVGLALSLPQTDSTVQPFLQEHLPRVWADLRQRQMRQLRDWRQAQKERVEEVATETAAAPTEDGISRVALPPEQVADDAELLGRHRRWCASLISRVLQTHREALNAVA